MAREAAASKQASGSGVPLPASLVGLSDLIRAARETEALSEVYRQEALRGHTSIPAPRVSGLLNELSIAGQYDLTSESGRAGLSRALATMQAAAPRLHISFASEPTADFTTKIVTWLRANIHPQLLVQIGLQPGIAVGCTLRTTNKYFDLSLRQTLLKRQDLLQKALAEAR